MDSVLTSSPLAWGVLWAARHALWLAPVAALLPILISLLLERRIGVRKPDDIRASSLAETPPEVGPAVEAERRSAPASRTTPKPKPKPKPTPEPRPEPEPKQEPVFEPRPAPVPEAAPAPAPEAAPAPAPEPEVEAETEPASAPQPKPESEPAPRRLPRASLRERLGRTSETLVGRLGGLLQGRTLDAELFEELEALLFTADLGVATAESLLEEVRKNASGADGRRVRQVLKRAILEKLQRVERPNAVLPLYAHPHVILVLGVNGSGKTTTIGKLAARYTEAGKKVILGAGDTYRAAAVDQLQVWAERVGCEIVAGKPGGDPAAVAFDTVKAAVARDADVAIVDTAGRLQTRKPLMEELGKIVRVLGRDVPGAPHESLLVLDANTGQNALSQARLFAEVTAVTGLVLTKLDGSAKGGVIVGLADEFAIPVNYVGIGESIEDLRDFEAREFADALFDTES